MAFPHTSSEFGPISGEMNILGNHFTGSSFTINPPDRNNDCLRHLGRTDPRDDKDRIQQTKGGLLKDAYDWILDHDDYKRWLDDPKSSLLWVKGDPGKGKTMLLCGVIDELQKSALNNRNQGLVSYFFCQATDQRLNNATNVLLGLIFLLVDQQKPLLSHFDEGYGRKGKDLFESINAWVALTRIFRAILADPQLPRIVLLVDALDECETDLENLLRLISETSSPASSSRVKWIVSSRYRSMIDEELRTVAFKITLSLGDNEALISRAVRTYIHRKVDDLAARKRYDDSLKDYVESYLVENANDTFLWVALVCGQLMDFRVTPRSTRQRLGSFPPGLDLFYERMLIQIDETDDADRCKRILAITLVAFQPLTLEELRALDDTFKGDTDDDMEAVIANSGSFLTIRDRLVYFVHQSATDFLLNKASHEIIPDGIQRKHMSIFSRSLQILSEVLRRDLYDLNDPGRPVNRISKPNLDPLAAVRYSCIYWIDHFIDGKIYNDGHYEIDLRDDGRIYEFLRKKYLYWVEALGLLGHVSHGILSIASLESLPQIGTQLGDFIRDASRFIRYFRPAIETCPLQVYASGLAFTPENSIMWRTFQKDMYRWICPKPRIPPDWSPYLQTLEESGAAKSMAFSPDSKLLVSGSRDGEVRVWSIATGEIRHTLAHGHNIIDSVMFSPDMKLLASGSSTIRIWSADTGALKQDILDAGGQITFVVFSPNSKILASCAWSSEVRIWSVATGTVQHVLQTHDIPESAVFSSDSTLLTASSKMIKFWAVATGTLQQTIKLKDQSFHTLSMAFSPDLKLVVLGSGYSTIRIWSVDTGVLQHEFKLPGAHTIAFSADSKLLAASNDYNIWTWSTATNILQHFSQTYGEVTRSLAFSHDLKLLASSSYENIRIWSTAPSILQQNTEVFDFGDTPGRVAFSSDLELLASSSLNSIRILSAATGALKRKIQNLDSYIYSIVFSPDSTLLASRSGGAKIKIWSIASGELQREFQGIYTRAIAFSQDSKLLALCSSRGAVRIWSTATGEEQRVFEGDDNAIRSTFTFNNGVISGSWLDDKEWIPNEGRSDYGFDDNKEWITFRRSRLLWLPEEFRPECYTISGSTIAIGCLSGLVFSLGLNVGDLASP